MRLTTAICTWNRAELLRRTLEGFTELGIPGDIEWELLVVANNCTDHTCSVLDSFVDRLPLRYVEEPIPGLSNARNRAVSEARGDYVLWTDDDVSVDPGWLAAYREAIREHPNVVVLGGPIEPWFEGTPPKWLEQGLEQIGTAYGLRALSEEPFRLVPDRSRLPFGANYGLRMQEQRSHPYDPGLGIRPDSRMGDEETSVIMNLLESGAEGWWVPGARIRHFVPKEHQGIAFLRRFFGAQGEGAVSEPPAGRLTLAGRPVWMWREAITAELDFRVRRLIEPPEKWLQALKHAAYVRGRLRGATDRTGS
jgi:glycosyltransferase involved in cell wall biosynthesis